MSVKDRRVQNEHRGCSGDLEKSSDSDSAWIVLWASTQSPRKSLRQCSHEDHTCKTTVYHILHKVATRLTEKAGCHK
jgi:hypothetical protein